MRISISSSEKDIENFLSLYPYLISPELSSGKLYTQYKIKIGQSKIRYIDILYYKKDCIFVIELKKNIISLTDLVQLSEYIDFFKKESPNKKIIGYIIGRDIKENTLLYLKNKNFIFKKLGYDIPLKIKFCANCRKAVNYFSDECPFCKFTSFIK
ncbi:MAG: endonuclease NucS domain-containing protein [Promethearchaeota archaeon]